MVGSLPGGFRRRLAGAVIPIAIAVIAAAYQIVAILACVFRRGQGPGVRGQANGTVAVSILKPVHGADPALREAIRSHTVFQGEYELLCAVSDPADPAISLLHEMS